MYVLLFDCITNVKPPMSIRLSVDLDVEVGLVISFFNRFPVGSNENRSPRMYNVRWESGVEDVAVLVERLTVFCNLFFVDLYKIPLILRKANVRCTDFVEFTDDEVVAIVVFVDTFLTAPLKKEK